MKKVTLSFPWPLTAAETRELLTFAFQVSLVTYLGFYLLESLNSGLISYSVDINAWLWLTVILGVLTAIWPAISDEKKPAPPVTWRIWLYAGILSLAGAIVVWSQISTLGGLRLVIAVLSGLIIGGLSLMLYFDHDESDRDLNDGAI